MDKKRLLKIAVKKLKVKYADEMRTSLNYSNPWELLVATILSAQAQDAQVNKFTVKMFKKYRTVKDFAGLKPNDLYEYTKHIGLYKGKSKNIIAAAKMLHKEFNDSVPRTMEDMLKLQGVGRKTANVVLSNAYGLNYGIAVDTHCIRVSNRLGIVKTDDPEKVEKALMGLVDRKDWMNINHLFIALGRDVCTARKKYCERCVLNRICVSSSVRK